MTDPLVCPVCGPRRRLRTLDPHLGLRVPLRRCDACRGIWAHAEITAVLKAHYHPSHYVLVETHARQSCRGCSRPLPDGAVTCARCNTDQRIQCVQCERAMEKLQIARVTLDVCRRCRCAWFDCGELGIVARRYSAELRRRMAPPLPSHASAATRDARFAYGADGAFTVVDGVAHAPQAIADAAAGAGDLALSAGAEVSELSGDVATLVLEIVTSVFD